MQINVRAKKERKSQQKLGCNSNVSRRTIRVMTQLPHAFRRIRLELARSKEFPNGSANHGYELVAPLDSDAHIDPVLWQKYRENCRVRRFWGNGEEIGYLLHKPGGPEHARWVFDYRKTTQESGYRLEPTPFVLANTSRSGTRQARPIHFGWFRWPP